MRCRSIFNRCFSLLTVVVVSSLAEQVAAQTDSLFLTVDKMLTLGTENSLRLQADLLGERMSEERSKTARTKLLPDLNVGLNGGFIGQPVIFQHGLKDPVRPETPDWSQNYAINLVQPIYQGGKIRYSIRKADIEREIAGYQTATDRSGIKLGLLQQYLNLFSLYKQEDVLNRNIDESERRLADIRRMKKEGLITNNDVLRSELQLTNNRLALKEAVNNIKLVSQQLDIWLGLDEMLIIIPDTNLLHSSVPLSSYEEYVQLAYENNPAMKMLRVRNKQASNEVRLAEAAYLPTVSISAGNTLARPLSRTLDDLYNNNWNIGLSISYSLSSLYNNRYKVREMKHSVFLAQNAEQQEMQQLRMKIRTAYLHHKEAKERVEALELSVKQAQENYRIMRNRYLEQLAILTDLLDADNVRLQSELQLTTAYTQVIYTYFELQEVCGQLY